jgi:hypothetical protein
VFRRCSASMTALVAALASSLGLQSTNVYADSISSSSSNPLSVTAEYTLTSTSSISAPTGPPPGTPIVTQTATLSSGSATVALPSTNGLAVGYAVTGTGVPQGTTITQINSAQSQVTLSQDVTSSGSQSLVFTPNVSPPQIVAQIVPAGGVYTPPTTSTVGPLTVLSTSKGFSASQLYDSLASTTGSNGQPEQLLGLSFYGQGLQAQSAGGVLNFTLAVTNPSSPPQLQSLTAGVTITLDSSSSGTGSTTSPPTTNPISAAETPEPLAVVVWVILMGVGIMRVWGVRQLVALRS